MKSSVLLACSLAICRTLGAATPVPRYFQKAPVTRRDLSTVQVQQELGRQVSNTTTIFGPEDSRYDNATVRWNLIAVPKIRVVIEPGQESDIPTIVSTSGSTIFKALE